MIRAERSRIAFVGFLVLLAAGFAALGVWQLERREWKHALIARVERNVHAAPIAAPGPQAWSAISADNDVYRHVTVRGHFLNDRETLVRAVTDLGAGYWVVTPLQANGFTVLVNRGFVPPDKRDLARRPAGNVDGDTVVTGLLRLSEPGGAFLRHNRPRAGRWYSRDVAAIARARGLAVTAPYFIDADATPNRGGYPVGGLTTIRFPDNHMVYAITWFALTLLAGWGAWYLVRMPASDRLPPHDG